MYLMQLINIYQMALSRSVSADMGPGLLENAVFKSVLVNEFLTWLLIGCQHNRQRIRSQVWKFLLINIDF